MIKVNLGCGTDIKKGWINVDKHQRGDVKGDITNLPFREESVDLVYCCHVLEHLSFVEEKKAHNGIYKVLKSKGSFVFLVPDLIWVMKQMLATEDKWSSFYKITNDVTDPQYAFGNGPGIEFFHGELMTHVYGNQINEGQYHKNGYTEGKVLGIAAFYNYEVKSIRCAYYKGVKNLVCTLIRR